MLKRNIISIALCGVALLFLSGCALGRSALQYLPGGNEGAGFFWGLLDGFLAVISFFISLFTDKITVYRTPNIGACYNFGYFWGMIIFFACGTEDGGGGSNKESPDPDPDPGNAEDSPRRAKKVRRGRKIRGTDIKIPPLSWN